MWTSDCFSPVQVAAVGAGLIELTDDRGYPALGFMA